MLKLDRVLDSVLEQAGIRHRVQEYRAILLWPEVVGKALARKTQARYVSSGTLFVTVSSSAWANQLLFLREGILAEFSKRLGPQVVTDIRFSTGQISFIEENPGTRQVRPDKRRTALKADIKTLEQMDRKRKAEMLSRSGRTCECCGIPVESEQSLCMFCEKEIQDYGNTIKHWLHECPWYDISDIPVPGVSKEVFSYLKKQEVNSSLDKIRECNKKGASAPRDVFLKLIMLIQGKEPRELTDADVRSALDPELYQMWLTGGVP
ncbi:MAG: DUF721 domain-containing protein [Bacillota bacterium]